jgi:phage terminase small subunit
LEFNMGEPQPGMSFWNELVLQPALTPAEKQLRDRFVTEYLIDYDAWAACLRVGFIKSVAMTYAQELLEDPYVRREITRRQSEPVNLEQQKASKQARLEAMYWEQATYRGVGASHSARVAALNSLSKIHKLIDPESDAASRDEALIAAFRDMAGKVPV